MPTLVLSVSFGATKPGIRPIRLPNRMNIHSAPISGKNRARVALAHRAFDHAVDALGDVLEEVAQVHLARRDEALVLAS